MDPYQILGIKRGASLDEAKKAYRKLASIHHPDKGGDTQRFQEIQTAYDSIASGQADQPRHFHWGGHSANFQDMQDILRRNFGNFANANEFDDFNHAHAVRNPDVTVRVTCTLAEAHRGFTRTLQFLLPQQGQQVKSVTFPSGSYEGIRIRYSGEGGQVVKSRPPGDLYCELVVEPHPYWKADFNSQNLEGDLTITAKEAMLGTVFFVDDIDGNAIEISVPAGTQPGSRLRLKDRGLNRFRQAGRGDAFVRITVTIPKLSKDDLHKPLIDLI